MSADSRLVAAAYWESRAREFAAQGEGLAAVCSYAMPDFYNRYIQHCQRRAVLPWLPLTRAAPSRALDVGCGVGRWSLELASRGHEVLGIDVSPTMIEQARDRAAAARARCTFMLRDITALQLEGSFDVIVCVTVLQHIVDPLLARAAVLDLAAHLTPKGRFILLEAAPTRATRRCDHTAFTTRESSWYVDALRGAGLRLVACGGVDPMPFKTWLLPHYKRLPAAIAKPALALVTALSLPLDRVLAPVWADSSWHRVFVAERTG